jgi:hypothetical protein
MSPRLRRGAIALCLAAAFALVAGSARAAEAGPGTKNFNVPAGVPDHFSNEAEPFAATSAAQGPVPRSSISRGARSRYVVDRRGRAVHGRLVHGRVVHGRAVASRGGHRGRASVHTVSRAQHGHAVSRAKTASRPHATAAKRRG